MKKPTEKDIFQSLLQGEPFYFGYISNKDRKEFISLLLEKGFMSLEFCGPEFKTYQVHRDFSYSTLGTEGVSKKTIMRTKQLLIESRKGNKLGKLVK